MLFSFVIPRPHRAEALSVDAGGDDLTGALHIVKGSIYYYCHLRDLVL